jgi:hypothetical protein
VALGQCEAGGVGDTLAEGTGGDLGRGRDEQSSVVTWRVEGEMSRGEQG